ncbi:hypothetical protein Ddc_18992 [Ditylenchus destructor]|nr:hypothetical protein Ddc_18992 [Ditylenchus destructor]
MQSASSTTHIIPGTNPAMGNPAGDMDSGLGQQQSAINQSFFDTLFNTQQNQHQSQSQGSFESDSYGHANNARSTAPTQSHSSVIVSSGQNAGSLDHDSDRHGSGDSSPLAKMPKLSSCSTSSSSSIQHNLMASLMNGTAGVSGNALHTLFVASSATSSVSTSAQKCEICSQEFTDQIMLKFHHISQHGLGNAKILSLLTQQQNQLPLNDGSDIITQIALEMAKANQAQNQGPVINNPALAAPAQCAFF